MPSNYNMSYFEKLPYKKHMTNINTFLENNKN